MDSNGTTTQNGNGTAAGAEVVLSPSRQESLSGSFLEASELGDETDIETMRQRIQEMEEEAEKLKQMQVEVERQIQLPGTPGSSCTFAVLVALAQS